jgi:hypothetical protein
MERKPKHPSDPNQPAKIHGRSGRDLPPDSRPRDGWHYAKGEKALGPLTFDELIARLRTISDLGDVQVWHAQLQRWYPARDVFRPLALFLESDEARSTPSRASAKLDLRAKADSGARYLFGKLRGLTARSTLSGALAKLDLRARLNKGSEYLVSKLRALRGKLSSLEGSSWRRSAYAAALVLGLGVVIAVLSNIQDIFQGTTVKNDTAELQQIKNQSQPDKVRADPSAAFSQLTDVAYKASSETGRLAQKLFNSIEPPGLAKPINYGSASQAELQQFRNDLQTAENNATNIKPHYLNLLKEERDTIEAQVKKLDLDDQMVQDLRVAIDKQIERSATFNSELLSAQIEFYHALGKVVDILIGQFGAYKIQPNGQFVFVNPGIAEQFTAAAREINAARRRLSELQTRRQQMAQEAQEGWQRIFSTQ